MPCQGKKPPPSIYEAGTRPEPRWLGKTTTSHVLPVQASPAVGLQFVSGTAYVKKPLNLVDEGSQVEDEEVRPKNQKHMPPITGVWLHCH